MQPNVILFTIDALRADHVSHLGYHRKTTPFIDELSSQGVTFFNAFSNGPTTPTSFPSIFASLYSFQLNDVGLPLRSVNTLPKVLKINGFETAGISPNDFVSSVYNYHQGFDVFLDPENWAAARDKIKRNILDLVKYLPGFHNLLREINKKFFAKSFVFTQKNAADVLKKAETWIKEVQNKDKPYFLWCHFNDVHHPWFPYKECLGQFREDEITIERSKALVNKLLIDPDHVWSNISKSEMDDVIDLYDASILNTDQEIKDFIKKNVDLNETTLVITSDHGEEFGDHGGFHRMKPYDEMLHVPLIFVGCNVPKEKKVHSDVSLINIPKTILGILEYDDIWGFEGGNLINNVKEEEILVSYNRELVEGKNAPEGEVILLRKSGWKFIIRDDGDELYNLDSDPNERKNLININQGVAAKLEKRLLEKVEQIGRHEIKTENVEINKEVRKRLEDLGYL